MATYINFKELRAKLLFTRVLEHYKIDSKRKGDRLLAFCPLPTHQQRTDSSPRTASLSISTRKQCFQCFGCKASGNAVDFAIRLEGFDPSDPQQFRAGALKVAELFGLLAGSPAAKGSQPERKPLQDHQNVVINAPLDFELQGLDMEHPYLAKRGLCRETIEYFGLGFCNRGLMKNRVVIPLHNPQGEMVGYAGRIVTDSMVSETCPKYLLPGTPERDGKIYEFKKSWLLFNHHRLKRPVDHLFVVEGFVSTFWLHQAKYVNTVTLIGSSCSKEQGELIVDLVKPSGIVWALPDGNQAGVQCAHSIFEQVSPYRSVRWVKLQENEQPTDFTIDELASLF